MIKDKRKDCIVKVRPLKLTLSLNKPKTVIEFYKTNPMILLRNIVITIIITVISSLISGIIGATIGCILSIIALLILDSHKIKHIQSS